jgi:hypothetical protein
MRSLFRPEGKPVTSATVANKPVLYHTAVSEAISTIRSLSPYQLVIVVSFQTVFAAWATTERFGRRSPLRRGLPICPGRRGGAGS